MPPRVAVPTAEASRSLEHGLQAVGTPFRFETGLPIKRVAEIGSRQEPVVQVRIDANAACGNQALDGGEDVELELAAVTDSPRLRSNIGHLIVSETAVGTASRPPERLWTEVKSKKRDLV